MGFPKVSTLAEARKVMLSMADIGVSCPCCYRYVKRYKRKLNSQMALWLVALYKASEKYPARYHEPREFLDKQGHKASSDGSYLVKWGLAFRPIGTNRYRLTLTGRKFVRGETCAPRYLHILNGNVVKRDEELTTIYEALGDKFNYAELMGA